MAPASAETQHGEDPIGRTRFGPSGFPSSAGAALTIAGAVMLGVGMSDQSKVEAPAAGSRDWERDGARAYERGLKLLNAGWVLARPPWPGHGHHPRRQDEVIERWRPASL